MKKECYGVDSEEELVRAREAARQEGAWSGTLARHRFFQASSLLSGSGVISSYYQVSVLEDHE